MQKQVTCSRGCGAKLYLDFDDPAKRTTTGRPIPYETLTGKPHECPNYKKPETALAGPLPSTNNNNNNNEIVTELRQLNTNTRALLEAVHNIQIYLQLYQPSENKNKEKQNATFT